MKVKITKDSLSLNTRAIHDRAIYLAKYILKFGTVGLLATITHFLFLWILFTYTSFAPLWANLLAYCIAFNVSFFLNFKWTFQSEKDPTEAAVKFLLASLFAMFTNSCIFYVLISAGWFEPFISACIAAIFSATFMFLLTYFWAFNQGKT
jgi:putative flippase GtrA